MSFIQVLSKSGLSWRNHFRLAKMHHCMKIKKFVVQCCENVLYVW